MKKCLSLKLHLHCNLRYEKHQKCVSRDSSWSPGLLVDSRDRPRFSWQNSTWVSSNMGVPAKHGHISMIRRTKDHGPLSNPGSVLLFCPLFFFFREAPPISRETCYGVAKHQSHRVLHYWWPPGCLERAERRDRSSEKRERLQQRAW